MDAAVEPTMEPTAVPEFHVEERDMLEEVFDILERGGVTGRRTTQTQPPP